MKGGLGLAMVNGMPMMVKLEICNSGGFRAVINKGGVFCVFRMALMAEYCPKSQVAGAKNRSQ